MTPEIIADITAVLGLIPQLIQLIQQWRQGVLTADQAAAEAATAFASMTSALKDPAADSAQDNAAADAAAKAKFGQP
jgi:hypothetical protein